MIQALAGFVMFMAFLGVLFQLIKYTCIFISWATCDFDMRMAKYEWTKRWMKIKREYL